MARLCLGLFQNPLNGSHLCVLLAVQREAADGFAVFDGRGSPGALEAETD